jgi:hypothetical protein
MEKVDELELAARCFVKRIFRDEKSSVEKLLACERLLEIFNINQGFNWKLAVGANWKSWKVFVGNCRGGELVWKLQRAFFKAMRVENSNRRYENYSPAVLRKVSIYASPQSNLLKALKHKSFFQHPLAFISRRSWFATSLHGSSTNYQQMFNHFFSLCIFLLSWHFKWNSCCVQLSPVNLLSSAVATLSLKARSVFHAN